ncbi:MAG TPA: hypothetical protein VNA16_02260 [Abditibacteriaceae bacterium]|nr:hypothetical protein [Abditibacteriaceae bacterium]
MHTFIFILQAITAITLIVLMAIQTDKAEQGGVMGLGATGGRSSGQIDMPVGAERILKPLTKWIIIGFLFCSALSSMGDLVTIWHFLGALVIYVLVMLFGGTLWSAVMGRRR